LRSLGLSRDHSVALTGLHCPHRLCADFHAGRALDRPHLVRRASIIRPLYAAVTFQGLRS
jgi:hypothetical protein